MKRKLKEDAENNLKQQMEFVEKMKLEFDEIRRIHDQEKENLEIKYNELNQLFEQRPSRPEDLELIQQLQQDNVIKEEELRKAVENLKFFKLELLNREDNFNRLFNANPNVGVLNPLDKVRLLLNFKNNIFSQKSPGFPNMTVNTQNTGMMGTGMMGAGMMNGTGLGLTKMPTLQNTKPQQSMAMSAGLGKKPSVKQTNSQESILL